MFNGFFASGGRHFFVCWCNAFWDKHHTRLLSVYCWWQRTGVRLMSWISSRTGFYTHPSLHLPPSSIPAESLHQPLPVCCPTGWRPDYFPFVFLRLLRKSNLLMSLPRMHFSVNSNGLEEIWDIIHHSVYVCNTTFSGNSLTLAALWGVWVGLVFTEHPAVIWGIAASIVWICAFYFFQDNNGVIGLVEPLKTSKVPVKLQMVNPVVKIASGKKKPIFFSFFDCNLLVFFKVCFSFIKETTTWSWSRWRETCTHWAPESRGSWEELLKSSQTAEAGKALVRRAGTSGPTCSLPDT